MLGIRKYLLVIAGIGLFAVSSEAQWVSQTIPLKQGWNAVFLEVDPYPNQCETLFQNTPIKSVWYYDQRFSPVQFIQDPSELRTDDPQWIAYFPANRPESTATSLYSLDAGKSYLIEMEQDYAWTIKGKPTFFHQTWTPNSYNLTGFFVDPQSPYTFANWFASSSAHKPLEVWMLGADQRWVAVAGTQPIETGKAYWVKCRGSSKFQGPVEVSITDGREVRFERDYLERFLEIRRIGTDARSVTIEQIASNPVPAVIPGVNSDDLLPLAGIVPLKYYGKKTQGTQDEFAFFALPATLSFPGGETAPNTLRLAVDRTLMAPYTGEGDALYQSILAIRDGKGYLRKIGVTSRSRFIPKTAQAAKMRTRQIQTNDPYAGLWIGYVTLNKVQEPNLSVTTATPAPFQFRIMVHVDGESNVRLLNEITLLWRDGTYKPNPQPGNPDAKSMDSPGHYILVTPTAPVSLLNELWVGETVHPSNLKDGRPFTRRISSAMFTLLDQNNNPETPLMQKNGTFGANNSELTIQLIMRDNDPLNPFHHQFHPQHAYPAQGEQPAAGNDWTIIRSISLKFSATPPTASELTGWGDTVVGGTYAEVLEGLKKDPVIVEGTFTLHQAADVPVLNDGLTQ